MGTFGVQGWLPEVHVHFLGRGYIDFTRFVKWYLGPLPSEKSLHLVSAYLGQALFKGLALNDAT